jgi:hypothetical protein
MATDAQFTFIKQKPLLFNFIVIQLLGVAEKVNLWNSLLLHQIANSHL